MLRSAVCILVVTVSASMAPPARGQTVVGPSDDVESAINSLGPGDELILSGGQYDLDERFSFDIAGTEAQPIVIRAADGERPHLHRPNADQNIIDIDNAEYVVLRGIEFSGGSAGIRLSGARHLTIEDCEIHDTADVALRANDTGVTYESLRILRNHIHHTDGTGEGMYLGCNNDGCRITNSLIEGNYVHHTNQASVEQGDGIEIKEGSYGNIVRDNVIHDTNYPCILTYGVVGNGPPNVIERNVLWNCGDHAIQSAADTTIRNNIILSANVAGIAMQPHQSAAPSNLIVIHNTVVHRSDTAIRVSGITGSVVIANNAVYSRSSNAISVNGDTSGLVLAGNVGVGGLSGGSSGLTAGDLGSDFVNGHYDGGPPIDLFPAAGSGLVGAGDAAHTTDSDFNGTPRSGGVDVGAYVFDAGGNPGWTISESFKGETVPPVGSGDDGGLPDTGNGGQDDSGGGGGGGGGGGSPPSGAAGDDGGCSCRQAPLASAVFCCLGLVAVDPRRRGSAVRSPGDTGAGDFRGPG